MNAIKELKIDKSLWIPVKFGDVAFEPKETAKDPQAEGIEHVVGLEHIDSENIHLVRSENLDRSTTFTKKFAVGDVLFGRRRAYLKKAAQASFKGICSGDITVLRAKDNLLPELLPFVVQNEKFFDYAIKHSAGGLSPRVKFKDLASYEFLLPPKDQQGELVELLEAINLASRKKELLVQRLELAPLSFFEDRMKDDSGNRVTLRDVLLNIFAGKSPKGNSRHAKNDEYGVLKVSAVGDGFYCETENKVLVRQEEFSPIYEVKQGYILVTRANALVSGVGRPCVVNRTRKGLMLSDKTLRLIPNDDLIRERFLFQLLRTKAYRNHVESVAGGTEAKNISQKLLGDAPVWLPGLHIQDEIVTKLDAMDRAISSATDSVNSLKAFQKTISLRMF